MVSPRLDLKLSQNLAGKSINLTRWFESSIRLQLMPQLNFGKNSRGLFMEEFVKLQGYKMHWVYTEYYYILILQNYPQGFMAYPFV